VTTGAARRLLKIISLLELGKAAEQCDDFEGAATAYLEASSIDGLYLQREVAYAKPSEGTIYRGLKRRSAEDERDWKGGGWGVVEFEGSEGPGVTGFVVI
jgi:hypothetical protein